MSMEKHLTEHMKEAMRAREAGRARLNVIRMLRAALQNEGIQKGRDLTPDEELQVIDRELKMRRESMEGFRGAGRTDEVERLEKEIAIVQEYLPEQLTADELAALVAETIAEVGAAGPADMGKVMGALMPRLRGRADGGEASRLVREKLAQI